eukprot:15436552-Alexandrium_andersonii.AAC.1
MPNNTPPRHLQPTRTSNHGWRKRNNYVAIATALVSIVGIAESGSAETTFGDSDNRNKRSPITIATASAADNKNND